MRSAFAVTTPLVLLLGIGVAEPPIRRSLPRREAFSWAMLAAAASQLSVWRAPER